MKRFAFLSLPILGILTSLLILNQRHQIVPTHFTSLTHGKGGSTQLSSQDYKNGDKRFADVKKRITPHLQKALSDKGVKLGNPVYLRSFKQERELELWMLADHSQHYQHVHTWTITGISGSLGPKLKEGDRQSPEGFYQVALPQFLHSSANHLAFNIGYPNKFDRAHRRTGSFIMVHGHTGSIGCLAMTDPYIEEIYTICHAALTSGNQKRFSIHTFPFRLSDSNLSSQKGNQWYPFWQNLKQGYDYFETYRTPPRVSVQSNRYVFK